MSHRLESVISRQHAVACRRWKIAKPALYASDGRPFNGRPRLGRRGRAGGRCLTRLLWDRRPIFGAKLTGHQTIAKYFKSLPIFFESFVRRSFLARWAAVISSFSNFDSRAGISFLLVLLLILALCVSTYRDGPCAFKHPDDDEKRGECRFVEGQRVLPHHIYLVGEGRL